MTQSIPRRVLGGTGLELSVLGLGGFHQVEIGVDHVSALLDAFLAAGGNYVETARSYGGGSSEEKLGRLLEGRRDRIVLVTKSGKRDAEGAWAELNTSLEALRTDHLDVWIHHGVNSEEEVATIAGPGGALEAHERARREGLVRFSAASSHWPMTLISAMERLHLDAIMVWVNYLARCNYPELEQIVMRAARARGLGIIGMKPLGDGYLWRSPAAAFTYALTQEVDVLACGFNAPEMLRADIEAVVQWQRPSPEALEAILRDAPELGDYICRQCGVCRMAGLDLPRVYELEGKYDQQMFDGRPHEAADYALRERLRFWFHNQERAQALYAPHAEAVAAALDSGRTLPECPYGIDLRHKTRLAHLKLTCGVSSFPRGVSTF